MIKILTGIKNDITRAPGKTILTLFTVALGVGILSIAISISGYLNTLVTEKLEKDGLIINFFNGDFSETGELKRIMPPETDQNILNILETDIGGYVTATPILTRTWSDIILDGKRYQIRNTLATNQDYFEIFELELEAGSFFTSQDVTDGNKKAVISSSLAEQLFGSSEAAVGKTFQPPFTMFERRGEEKRAAAVYTIQGVFREPDEFVRTSYQVADMVLPFTSVFEAGRNASRMFDMAYTSGTVKVEGYAFDQAEAMIRQSLASEYGDDITLTLWEGSIDGDTSTIEEARNTVSTFSIVVNILGIVLLLTGSIGILSIMMIEALGRTREIAIERALGASRLTILKEFFNRSVVLTMISIITGLILAAVFIRPFAALLGPVFTGIGISEAAPSLTPAALGITVVSAMLSGGVFGVIPVISLMSGSIADTIREG